MARGWESKSVEEQQAEAAATRSSGTRHLTPDQAAREQTKLGLSLSRQRVLQQLEVARNPTHRHMLERALADLDAQLSQLG